MNKTQQLVLVTLYEGGAHSEGDRMYTYKSLERETKKNHRSLKGAITVLRINKFVHHGPSVDIDGRPCGSGFMLTSSGDRLALEFGAQE